MSRALTSRQHKKRLVKLKVKILKDVSEASWCCSPNTGTHSIPRRIFDWTWLQGGLHSWSKSVDEEAQRLFRRDADICCHRCSRGRHQPQLSHSSAGTFPSTGWSSVWGAFTDTDRSMKCLCSIWWRNTLEGQVLEHSLKN